MLQKHLGKVIIISFMIGIGIFVTLGIALAHGSMDDPISRVYACYLEGPETPDTVVCSDVIESGGTQQLYDWNEINISNAAGNHQALIPDGQLCSAGRAKYAAFDEPRTDWARTILPDSGMYTFLYQAYVPHNQGYFELWVTKDGYDPTQPLAWDDIEMFALVDEPPVVDGDYYMPVQLPQGKSGHHVIYAIWQRNDSPEAFYSCSDVWFGDSPTPVPTTAPSCTAAAWNSTTTYQQGDVVSHNNAEWRANWGSAGSEPSGSAAPWRIRAYCQSDGSTPVPPTDVPPTDVPPTDVPPTGVPPTDVPATTVPTATPASGACVVTYDVINQWSNVFQANVTITNNNSTAVSGWTLQFTHASGQTATGGWNATISQSGNQVTTSNPASHWNGTIGANGGAVVFGLQGTFTGSVVVPTDFVLNGTACNEGDPPPTAVPPTATSAPPTATSAPPTATAVPPTATSAPPTSTPGDCVIDYNIVNQWETGFQADITVTNLESTAVAGYTLAWDFDNGEQFSIGWNATYNQSGTTMTASNVASHWNGTIAANGGTVSFGFITSHSGATTMPTNFTLNGVSCSSS